MIAGRSHLYTIIPGQSSIFISYSYQVVLKHNRFQFELDLVNSVTEFFIVYIFFPKLLEVYVTFYGRNVFCGTLGSVLHFNYVPSSDFTIIALC